MGIKLTVEEARKAGFKRIDGSKIDKSLGVTIDDPRSGYLCYMGPCSDGVREVCYYDNGCTDCYLEDC